MGSVIIDSAFLYVMIFFYKFLHFNFAEFYFFVNFNLCVEYILNVLLNFLRPWTRSSVFLAGKFLYKYAKNVDTPPLISIELQSNLKWEANYNKIRKQNFIYA